MVDPAGPLTPGTATTTVTVTATLAEVRVGDDGGAGGRTSIGDGGDVHGDVAGDVVYGVTPVAPAVTQAVCRGGVLAAADVGVADD